MTEPHLWDFDHPYYCAEGNFYQRGCHNMAGSWQEFYDMVRDWDPDMNLLFRWDWFIPSPDLLPPGKHDDRQVLFTHWVGQRKATLWSWECPVTPEDEPAIRAWLEERAKIIAAIWAPISLLPEAARA